MATMSIRKIPDEVHNAIKARALKAGHSAEEEVRQILQETVLPKKRLTLSDYFAEFRRRTGGIDLGDLREKDDEEAIDFSNY